MSFYYVWSLFWILVWSLLLKLVFEAYLEAGNKGPTGGCTIIKTPGPKPKLRSAVKHVKCWEMLWSKWIQFLTRSLSHRSPSPIPPIIHRFGGHPVDQIYTSFWKEHRIFQILMQGSSSNQVANNFWPDRCRTEVRPQSHLESIDLVATRSAKIIHFSKTTPNTKDFKAG